MWTECQPQSSTRGRRRRCGYLFVPVTSSPVPWPCVHSPVLTDTERNQRESAINHGKIMNVSSSPIVNSPSLSLVSVCGHGSEYERAHVELHLLPIEFFLRRIPPFGNWSHNHEWYIEWRGSLLHYRLRPTTVQVRARPLLNKEEDPGLVVLWTTAFDSEAILCQFVEGAELKITGRRLYFARTERRTRSRSRSHGRKDKNKV